MGSFRKTLRKFIPLRASVFEKSRVQLEREIEQLHAHNDALTQSVVQINNLLKLTNEQNDNICKQISELNECELAFQESINQKLAGFQESIISKIEELQVSNSSMLTESQESYKLMIEELKESNADLKRSVTSNHDNLLARTKEIYEKTSRLENEINNQVKPGLMQTLNVSREILWAEVFKQTITGSKWLHDVSFSPGRWAVGYPFLYTLYKALTEGMPKRILDLGLGQSSIMIQRYCHEYPDVTHIVVEHDKNWIEFFEKSNQIPTNSDILLLDLMFIDYPPATTPVRVYDSFAERLGGQKFDLISIDGPFGFDMKELSRIDVLSILPDCLFESFIIIIDDCHRTGESNMVKLILDKLSEAGISPATGEYKGEKNVMVICSIDNSFLCSV